MTIRELERQYAEISPKTVDAFIKNIHAAKNAPEIRSQDLIGFMDRLIEGFRPEGRRICMQAPSLCQADKDVLTMYGKIVAAYILLCHAASYSSETREKTLLFLEYASAVVKSRYDFVQVAVSLVSYPVTATGLDWKTVQDAPSLDMVAYKLTTGIRFDRHKGEFFQYADRGKVVCRDGVLTICSADVGEAGAKAFSLFGEKVEVVSRNSREEKLRASCQRDIGAVGEFAGTFLSAQQAYVKSKTRKREYSSGDLVDIILTETIDEKGLRCKVLDPDNPVAGHLVDEELIRGTDTADLRQFLFSGDVIRGAVMHVDDDGVTFSIRQAYRDYALGEACKDDRAGTVFEAVVTHVHKEIERVNWMTPRGYGAISYPLEGDDVKEGDIRVMSLYNIQTNGPVTYINICPPKMGYEAIDEHYDAGEDGQESRLQGFVTTQEAVLKDRSDEVPEQNGDAETIRILASVIASVAARQSSLESYEGLLAAIFMLTAAGETAAAEGLMKDAYLLRMKISYAQGIPIPANHPYRYEGEAAGILELLSRSAHPDASILPALASFAPDSTERKIGELLAGQWLAVEHCDELKVSEEEVRKKICTLLGVEGQYSPVSGVRTGKYGQVETHDVEFKSSYVFRNDGKGADLAAQGRGEVFEAVCGFLNAEGGTLYLGVNDAGMPIRARDYGLQADMEWLSANYQTVNASRSRQLGHPTMKADTLDHYVLFLNDEKAIYFKESLQGNITIEVTEDADAIRLTVRPSEYELAYLYADSDHRDGVAFVRDGGRTVPMTNVQKERRLTSLKRISKEMGFVVTIQEAIDQHRKLIFKDYASGNSGKVKDRFVVPVNLFYNDENVYCYDLEAHAYKQFRLKRISAIETEVDNPVYPLPLTAPKGVDVFRWLDDGGRKYHVKLRMGVSAKNYLLEEYSCAEKLPGEELYPEKKDQWILDTHVNGLGAVRRFYLGLADKIEILDTEDSDELKAEIRRFIAEDINLG